MRTVGIEEELLVVEAESGRPMSVAGRLLRGAKDTDVAGSRRPGEDGSGEAESAEDGPGGTLGAELQQQQLETDTPPRTDLRDLDHDVRRWRDAAIVGARRTGARIVAAGTSPMPVRPTPNPDPRYLQMRDRFGLTTAEQLCCGCHVHVSVDSDDEAVGVLDRIRVWLPSLLAISANSPFWQGTDSGTRAFVRG